MKGVATAPKSSMNVHLLSAWGYDEPEIFCYSNRRFGLIGADGGQTASITRAAGIQRWEAKAPWLSNAKQPK